jgi:hypothetical protein
MGLKILLNKPAPNTGYTSCGFQCNLQVCRSLAKAVTVDSEVATNSRTLHTLNVSGYNKNKERMVVIFDTNAYRELFHDKSLNECIEIIENIRKRELELNIHAFISPIVWLELFVHLADFEDKAFEVCINSVCGSYLHTRSHIDDLQYQIIADSDDLVAKSLFDFEKIENQQVYKHMDYIASEIYKNPCKDTIIKHREFFQKSKKAVENQELKFRNSFIEIFNNEFRKTLELNNNKTLLKNFIGTNNHFSQLAFVEVFKAIKYSNIDTTQLSETYINKHIEFIKSYFPAPLHLGTKILKEGLFQQDFDITKKNRPNWYWDYKILFYISKLTENLLITRDKAMVEAANSAGLNEKIKNLDEYKMMIE